MCHGNRIVLEDLATGVNKIDNQHKELFKRINNLLEACNQEEVENEGERLLEF